MKPLRHFLDRQRARFEEGRRLHALKPLFDAIDHFFFATDRGTRTAPHVRDPMDIKRYMSVVIVALIPCTLAGVYFFGLRTLAVIAVSYACGGAVEVIVACIRKHEINEGFLVTGLLFPLILPPGLPLWMVAVGVIFGVLVGKELFGGTGRNLFNPALVGRAFLAVGYPAAMGGYWVRPGSGWTGNLGRYIAPEMITEATPLANAKMGEYAAYGDLFLGQIRGCIGETSALCVLIGGAFLLLTRVGAWRAVAGVLGSFLLLETILWRFAPGQFGPPLWQLAGGGLMFGAFFMATDPVTGPVTRSGKLAYGVLIGTLTVLIRHLTGYVEGVMFAILLGNIAAPLMDEVTWRRRYRRIARER